MKNSTKPIYKMTLNEKLDYYKSLPKDLQPRDFYQMRKTDYEVGEELTIVKETSRFPEGTKVKVIGKDLYGYHISKGNTFTWVNEKHLSKK